MGHKRHWMTTVLCAILVACAIADSRTDGLQDKTEVAVWPGDDVDFKCGDPHVGSVRRFWRHDNEILTAADNVIVNDDRITQLNYSAILRMVNVSVNDEGDYECVVNAKPRYRRVYTLRIKEFLCEIQEQPLNGGYINSSDDSGGPYKAGDQIQYFCNKGYRLVGPTLRTCSGTDVGWTPTELPYCEPEYIAKIRQQLTGFESEMENKMSKVENNMVTIETRLPAARPPNPLLNKTDVDLAEWFWSSCSNSTDTDSGWPHDDSRLTGRKRVFMASEFKWTVDNIRGRTSRLTTSTYEIQESQPFYATVPGYRCKLQLLLYYTRIFSVDFLVVKGEFDDQLSWPAKFKYEITVTLLNGTEVLYKYFNPSTYPACLPQKPTSASSISCTIPAVVQANDLFITKNYVLSDDSIIFKAYVYV